MCESTDLDVVKKALVDAEQSMVNFGSQVMSIHYFLVSASESTTNLLFIPHSACYYNVSYIEAKKLSITFKYTLISTILNQSISQHRIETIGTPLHCRFSQVFKIQLETFVIFPYGSLFNSVSLGAQQLGV